MKSPPNPLPVILAWDLGHTPAFTHPNTPQTTFALRKMSDEAKNFKLKPKPNYDQLERTLIAMIAKTSPIAEGTREQSETKDLKP